MTETNTQGKTTVSPDVLTTIARLAALEVPGVSRLAPISGGVNNTVFADLHLVLKADVNIREVSRNVQQSVARAIQEMVGMDVGQVNIHIEDIDYEDNEA